MFKPPPSVFLESLLYISFYQDTCMDAIFVKSAIEAVGRRRRRWRGDKTEVQ
jgi:hypothetical protein